MLHDEYSDPRALIDDAVATGQFGSLFDAMRERREEKADWEFYLAKVKRGMTFQEFRAARTAVPEARAGRAMTEREILAQTLAIAGVAHEGVSGS